MQLRISRLALATSIAAMIFLLACTFTAVGQSGRRSAKPAPKPAATPEPTPIPQRSPEKEKPLMTFLLSGEHYSGFARLPISFYDVMLRSCAEELDRPASVRVEVTPRPMGRGEAIKRAKAEKEAYVVWLRLRGENLLSGDTSSQRPDELTIEYTVFTPTTAKVRTSGQTYVRVSRRGGVIYDPRASGIYGDQALKQAAREAGARILDSLGIPILPDTLP